MTERQFRAWECWLEEEWNTPDRNDYYSMQSAMEACRGRLKNPSQVKLDDFRLKFQFKQRKVNTYLSLEERARVASENSKAVWLGMMTMPVEGLPDELKHPSDIKREQEEVEQDRRSVERYR